MSENTEGVVYCSYCQENTLHIFFDAGYKDDQSHNWKKCMACQRRKDNDGAEITQAEESDVRNN